LSCVGVTYRTGFGLDDLIYCTLYIHKVRDYRHYNAIAILHTFQFTVTHALVFSVFTSRILATDLSQSHCHFKSHMKPSLHRLIPFLPSFCSCNSEDSTRLLFHTPFHNYYWPCPSRTPWHEPHRKHNLYC
jgi:hypothetical protein